MVEGNLTVADLARWLGRPHPTVRYWISTGRREISAPGERAHIMREIEFLERLIKERQGLPVPRMSARERKNYVVRLKGNHLSTTKPLLMLRDL